MILVTENIWTITFLMFEIIKTKAGNIFKYYKMISSGQLDKLEDRLLNIKFLEWYKNLVIITMALGGHFKLGLKC